MNIEKDITNSNLKKLTDIQQEAIDKSENHSKEQEKYINNQIKEPEEPIEEEKPNINFNFEKKERCVKCSMSTQEELKGIIFITILLF